jgi:mono/diheme cytochrome c family protein
VRNVFVVLVALLVAGFAVSSCSKGSNSSSSSMGSSTEAAMATAAGNMAAGASHMAAGASHMTGGMANSAGSMVAAVKLPIPLSKLPSATVAAGNATAGAAVFSANCASCHGAGGKNGQVGPQLAGVGLKPGQVAYMVSNPQGVDKDSGMPKLPLTNKQIADVAAYVASLK